ncbi:MAG: bifunctional diaminohydroxyphosphoribosylaminopyrimidine deaminase/5-amino-6-(5-phosphoribosylamino)uracil reductase RibD [Lachnospiraceae bacterium]|nr:bifunctional diaminohydroxyphosphoribosylaminopyrimidine deaminase/5-amino-6-(5-phosphoribosylamino)uracil reductase RibD [Lachnospiraceae bacterium]
MTDFFDENCMRRAIMLAKLGEGYVHPNPLVGAVIVKDGKIVGEGYHKKYGMLHAEREALASLRHPEDAIDATLYVTLEPCCHYGKTPPCTKAIIEHKIKRVVIGSRDPNPLVAGKGAKILREHGIQVEEDFLREECDAINPIFFHYITTGRPYVFLKYAQTMDGKIATKTGASQWISGEEARWDAHLLRHRCMGILVGIRTVLQDNPTLTARMNPNRKVELASDFIRPEDIRVEPRSPIRIILDSNLRIPVEATVVQTAKQTPTIVVVDENLPREKLRDKLEVLHGYGVKMLAIKRDEDTKQLSFQALLEALGHMGIDSLMIEGGGYVNESAIREDIVDEIHMYLAPKIFGGDAPSPVRGIGVEEVENAKRYHFQKVEKLGEDLKICYRKSGD